MAGSSLILGQDSTGKNTVARVGADGHLGSSVGTYQSGSGTITGSTYAFLFAHTAANIDITSTDISGTLSGVVVPAGAWYRLGRATSIIVNSGAVTAYDA